MGTSGASPGPRNGGNLLPPGAPPPPEPDHDDEEPADEPDEQPGDPGDDAGPDSNGDSEDADRSWSAARRAITDFSRYAAQGRTTAADRSLRRGLRRYVRSQGGSKSSAHASASGRQAARALGSFLSTVAGEGVAEAVRRFNLESYRGSDATTLLAALTDRLVARSGLDEDAVARKAMCETLLELVDEHADDPLELLQDLTSERIRWVLERYIGHHVSERVLQVLGERWEANNVSEADVVRQGQELEEYILFSAESLFRRIDPLTVNWDGEEGERVVRDLFEEAHALLEAPA